MSKSVIHDWVVELGFDDSKVIQGIKRTEKALQRLERMQQRIAKRATGVGIGGSRSTGARTNTPRSTGISDQQKINVATGLDLNLKRATVKLGEASAATNTLRAKTEALKAALRGVKSPVELARLKAEIRNLRFETSQAVTAANKHKSAVNAQRFAAKGAADSMRNLARSYVSVFAALELGSVMFNTGKQFENMEATMLMTSGTTQQAKIDMDEMITISKRLGLSVLETAKSFSKYGIAAKSAGLGEQETKRTFEDMAIAVRSTGLAQDKANLAFLAMQQMLSNGVVSMQELKLQLSEQLPQTMGVAEEALRNLGYETGSVKDIISTGAVESGSFVKELTRLLKKQAVESGAYEKSIQSVEATQSRFITSLQLLNKQFFDAGKGGLASMFDSFTAAVERVSFALGDLSAGGLPFRIVGGLVDIVSAAFSPLMDFFSSMMDLFSNIADLILPEDFGKRFWEGLDKGSKTAGGILSLIPSAASLAVQSAKGEGSYLDRLSANFRSETGKGLAKAEKINSDNSVSVTISTSADPKEVEDRVRNVLQDTFKVGS